MILARKDLYDLSDPLYPRARQEERQIMIDLLAIEPHHVVCDAPAWGGYLAEGITNLVDRKQIICVEPSPRFAEKISNAFTVHCAQQTTLPLPSASVDRFGSLVGMHHLPDKLVFVREACRVLKPGGRIAVSEVLEGSQVATFLNGPVNKYATNGHKGAFVRSGECSWLLEAAGCEQVVERFYELHWVFSSMSEMSKFCRGLFGLAKATEPQTLAALLSHFDVKSEEGLIKLPWLLVYAVGTKT